MNERFTSDQHFHRNNFLLPQWSRSHCIIRMIITSTIIDVRRHSFIVWFRDFVYYSIYVRIANKRNILHSGSDLEMKTTILFRFIRFSVRHQFSMFDSRFVT